MAPRVELVVDHEPLGDVTEVVHPQVRVEHQVERDRKDLGWVSETKRVKSNKESSADPFPHCKISFQAPVWTFLPVSLVTEVSESLAPNKTVMKSI